MTEQEFRERMFAHYAIPMTIITPVRKRRYGFLSARMARVFRVFNFCFLAIWVEINVPSVPSAVHFTLFSFALYFIVELLEAIDGSHTEG